MLWLLPVVFAIHNGEELLTMPMPAWIAAHRQELGQLAQTSAVAARVVRSLATTAPQIAVAIGFIFTRPDRDGRSGGHPSGLIVRGLTPDSRLQYNEVVVG